MNSALSGRVALVTGNPYLTNQVISLDGGIHPR